MMEQLSFINEEPKCVLMSLKEEYYNKMLNGTKKYEYRTRYLKECSDAYIYISRNKKSIVAKIRFGTPIIGDAKTIATLAEQEEPGCYSAMIEYFNKNIGYAIPIKSITPINTISLTELKQKFPNFVVPQSYYILNKKPELFSFLESRLEEQKCVKN